MKTRRKTQLDIARFYQRLANEENRKRLAASAKGKGLLARIFGEKK